MKRRRWWHAPPEWFWGLVAFLAGLAVYGSIGVYRGARRKLRRKASDVWDEPSLPGSRPGE